MRFRRSAPVLSAVSALLLVACAHDPPSPVCVLVRDHNEQCAQKLAEGDLERAETYCDLGLEFSPQSADLWANKGLIALYRGDTAKAKERLLWALQYNPDHREAQVHLGSAYLEEGAYAQARERFVQALKGDPKFVPARYALGLALVKLGRRAEARTELDAVLAADPGHVDAHHTLGILDYEEERLEGAFQHLSRVAQLTPEAPVVWMELGTVLMAQRRFSEAEVAFGHCVLLEEAHADCRKGLARARHASSP
ncbi:tetratricopeptide repeat protein [Pyxidicoccus trucidator]|uniref:tetratricopeptide repeat protein n=1 Tax=Pyxidicoccus trucidator TaxID=2709662 RepID=UPI0013DCC8C4|nr:tetratricopeptide repeat protein [Pyxidicoccus trucidator]